VASRAVLTSALLLGVIVLLWQKGAANTDEVMGILERLIAVVLLIISLCVGALHLLFGFALLALALALPRARQNQAPQRQSTSDDIFLPF
jgi:vacuolar-type H+-ATPase subunit I/STV1